MGKIDEHFANLIQRLAGNAEPELQLAAKLVSIQCGEGHICVDLASVAGMQVPSDWQAWSGLDFFPGLNVWKEKLEKSNVVGPPDSFFPLILNNENKLYLQRFYSYEKTVADFLHKKNHMISGTSEVTSLQQSLRRFFDPKSDELDWQQIAAVAAFCNSFCVISGGPGTGKTTTVAKIIALLADHKKNNLFRVALAAPTGKAAAKLLDSIRTLKVKACAEILQRNEVKITSGTLHRFLGIQPRSDAIGKRNTSLLPFDLIIVDEASMVDLPLMARLVSVIGDQTRLILLGDREQLASVEPGSVFGDLCPQFVLNEFSDGFRALVCGITGFTLPLNDKSPRKQIVADFVVQLKKNYRFSHESSIQQVIQAMRCGDAEAALAVFDDQNCKEMRRYDLPGANHVVELVSKLVDQNIIAPITEQSVAFTSAVLEKSCVLCALRHGPYGVEEINRLAQNQLVKKKKVLGGEMFFPGLPVMITSNDYSLGLFNGDVGVVVEDSLAPEGVSVVFPGENEKARLFALPLLPPFEPVFAMTVHKSQGMEFDHVCLILPDRSSPVLTRELIYTAISRARKTVEVWGSREIFAEAVHNKVKRDSGLGSTLWGQTQEETVGGKKLIQLEMPFT